METYLPSSPPKVAPFARALTLLGTFTPERRWLGASDLAECTGIPVSTTKRLAQSLLQLGYLCHDPLRRKYRLSPSVLMLGYAAQDNPVDLHTSQAHMQGFAEQQGLHVNLSSRDRLDLVVLQSYGDTRDLPATGFHVGARVSIAESPLGWTLLASIPEMESNYLLEQMANRAPRGWSHLRKRFRQAIVEVKAQGFCSSLSESGYAMDVIAAPLRTAEGRPQVLACATPWGMMSRARVERVLGPRLLAMAASIELDSRRHTGIRHAR
ncbi:MAG: helix-turn-helix domain-containing protein [Ottowia sp.]|uniref:IclR family transcriptional regulator n=1 Tax=Ottowia sp. TaxID=1898956 RepID=UPI003C796426